MGTVQSCSPSSRGRGERAGSPASAARVRAGVWRVSMRPAAFSESRPCQAIPDWMIRYAAVASQLRCPVCQGESIQESPAELAKEMRQVVREQLAAGRSSEEVKAYFVSKYGEWILLEPKAHGANLTVYLLPFVHVAGWRGADRDRGEAMDALQPGDAFGVAVDGTVAIAASVLEIQWRGGNEIIPSFESASAPRGGIRGAGPASAAPRPSTRISPDSRRRRRAPGHTSATRAARARCRCAAIAMRATRRSGVTAKHSKAWAESSGERPRGAGRAAYATR